MSGTLAHTFTKTSLSRFVKKKDSYYSSLLFGPVLLPPTISSTASQQIIFLIILLYVRPGTRFDLVCSQFGQTKKLDKQWVKDAGV